MQAKEQRSTFYKEKEKDFFTIEEPRYIKDLNIDEDDNILLEDLTNLLSNNLFNEAGLKNNFKEITEKIFF